MRHPLVGRGMAPNGGNHGVMKMHNLFRHKPTIGKAMRWVGFTHSEKWQFNLVEIIIFHGPENIAPRGIQRVNRTITLRAIGAKFFEGHWRRAHACVVTT